MATPVLIDCDPGTDDAIALALAAVANEIDLKAVTTVAGNQTLQKTTANALGLLSLFDRPKIPVSSGLARPIVREPTPAPEVHGESGLADIQLGTDDLEPTGRHAVDEIYERAIDENGLTILAVGPLTNVAIAIRRYPDLVQLVEEIVVMGGSIAGGNVTPAAEFNVYSDPEAAQIVFDSSLPVTMVGLDVTREARIGEALNERIRGVGGPVGDTMADLIQHLRVLHRDRYGWTTAPVHDALAAAYLVEPSLLTTEAMRVDVERHGERTTGATVCDRLGATDRAANVDVATAVDADRFETILLEHLERYE